MHPPWQVYPRNPRRSREHIQETCCHRRGGVPGRRRGLHSHSGSRSSACRVYVASTRRDRDPRSSPQPEAIEASRLGCLWCRCWYFCWYPRWTRLRFRLLFNAWIDNEAGEAAHAASSVVPSRSRQAAAERRGRGRAENSLLDEAAIFGDLLGCRPRKESC
jgi:hypothetical protein